MELDLPHEVELDLPHEVEVGIQTQFKRELYRFKITDRFVQKGKFKCYAKTRVFSFSRIYSVANLF